MATTPNEVILNDNMRKQIKLMEELTKWIEAVYLQTQEEESTKTPKKIRPYTVNINTAYGQPTGTTPLAFQVLPRNFARNGVALYNIGPGDLLFCNTWFDPASILQQFSDPNHPNVFLPSPNQVVEIGFLPTGSSTSIDSTDALWVYNIGSNCVLSIIETNFARAGNTKGPIPPVGLDGAIGAGYQTAADVDGNPILVKGLR